MDLQQAQQEKKDIEDERDRVRMELEILQKQTDRKRHLAERKLQQDKEKRLRKEVEEAKRRAEEDLRKVCLERNQRVNQIACDKIAQDQLAGREMLADKDRMLQLMQQLNFEQQRFDEVFNEEEEDDNDLDKQLGEGYYTPVHHGKKTHPRRPQTISCRGTTCSR